MGRQCTFLVLRYFIPNGIEVQIVVIIRNVNIQKFYLFGNSNFKISLFVPPIKLDLFDTKVN